MKMKTLLLLLFTLVSIAASAATSQRQPRSLQSIQRNRNSNQLNQDQNDVDYQWPDFRYVPWSELENRAAAEVLGYTERTWNVPGTAQVESLAFFQLNETQIEAAFSMGFDQLSWDCNIVHFFWGYAWDDLEFFGVNRFYERLGWNESSWAGDTAPPETFRMRWDDLNPNQQDAAEDICWFEELWNMENIERWGQEGQEGNRDDYDDYYYYDDDGGFSVGPLPGTGGDSQIPGQGSGGFSVGPLPGTGGDSQIPGQGSSGNSKWQLGVKPISTADEPQPQPESEPEPELELEPEPEPQTPTESLPETQTQTEPDFQHEQESKAEQEMQPEQDAQPEQLEIGLGESGDNKLLAAEEPASMAIESERQPEQEQKVGQEMQPEQQEVVINDPEPTPAQTRTKEEVLKKLNSWGR